MLVLRPLSLLLLRRQSRRGGRVLLTEILLPRIARQGTVCLIPIRHSARTNRIEKLELDKLELRDLSSIRVSKRIIPPSETSLFERHSPSGDRHGLKGN